MDDPNHGKPRPKAKLEGKVFMTAAYLKPLELHTYGLFRDLVHETSGSDGPVREKMGNPIGPVGVFRPCEPGEEPDLQTDDPKTGGPLNLKRVSS